MNDRPTILLVDDTDVVRRTVAMLLDMEGWTVADVAGVAEARSVYAEHRSSLLAAIVDVQLGHDSGLDFIDELRSHDPQLPVVLVTGLSGGAYACPENVVVLQKPFGPEPLFEAIRSALTLDTDSQPRADLAPRPPSAGHTPTELTDARQKTPA